MGALLAGAMFLLTSTVVSVFVRIEATVWHVNSIPVDVTQRMAQAGSFAFAMLFVGLGALLIGVSLAGWLHSRTLGYFATGIAALCAVVIAWRMKRVVRTWRLR